MTSPPLRAVFFDAGGTLFHVRGSVGAVYAQEAECFGIEADAAELDAAFRTAFRKSPPLAFPGVPDDALLEHERRWWRRVVERTFSAHPVSDFDLFFETLYSAFATERPWTLYPDTITTLRQLRQAGLRVGVISNFDSRLLPLVRALGLDELLDSITLSSRVGVAKPGVEIFTHALRQHGLEPAQALHVGDSIEEDVRGAQRTGMHALLVRSSECPGLGRVVDLATGSSLQSDLR